jgi:hypothetical protein
MERDYEDYGYEDLGPVEPCQHPVTRYEPDDDGWYRTRCKLCGEWLTQPSYYSDMIEDDDSVPF